MPDIDGSGCAIVERNPNKLGGVPTARSNRVRAATVLDAANTTCDYGLPDDEIAYAYSLPIEDVRTILA